VFEDVPIPPAYPSRTSTLAIDTQFTSTSSLNGEKYPEIPLPPGLLRDSVLLKIWQWRTYVRAITLLVTITSFVLILVGLVTYEKTKASGLEEMVDPYTGEEIYVEITTKPNITFAAIGGVNTLFSALLLVLCWKSSKISHANNISNAVVCIIGFAGFASTMSACVYLQQNSGLGTTLWEWACYYRDSSDPALRYGEICRVIDVSWVLGLLQAVFDLLTVLLSSIAFCLWKWRLLSRYGGVGRVF